MDKIISPELVAILPVYGAAALLLVFIFISRRIEKRLSPMLPLPVQSMFTYCMFFTVGIAILSTRASAFLPFGILLSFVGVAIFLPEHLAARFFGIFLLLLILSLAAVWQQLCAGEPLFQPRRLSIQSASIFAIMWGVGIMFAWRRWRSGRIKGKDDTNKSPRQPPLLRD